MPPEKVCHIEEVSEIIFNEQNRKEYNGRNSGPFDLSTYEGCEALASLIVEKLQLK